MITSDPAGWNGFVWQVYPGKQMIAANKKPDNPVNKKVCECGLQISDDRQEASVDNYAGHTVK